jgi:hypothetical protein
MSWTSAGWTSEHDLPHLGLKDHALALIAILDHGHLFTNPIISTILPLKMQKNSKA